MAGAAESGRARTRARRDDRDIALRYGTTEEGVHNTRSVERVRSNLEPPCFEVRPDPNSSPSTGARSLNAVASPADVRVQSGGHRFHFSRPTKGRAEHRPSWF